MDNPNPCPMCGAIIGAEAKRCLCCGESFAQAAPKPSLLKTQVNMVGILPGGIAGVLAYLAYVILGQINLPGFNVSPSESLAGGLLWLISGSLIGSAIAAGARALRLTHSNPDAP